MPASPWWGGFYERLVRSVKLTLRKTLGKSFLTFEELQTILCEIEYLINCRPLVYTSSDDVHEGLTPFHLMYGRNLIDHKLKEKHNGLIPESTNIPKMVRKLQDKINCYWSSFAKCYLNELRQFHIYRRRQSGSSCELEMGDIVLIKEDFKVPRNVWKLGKVVELVKGRDGKTRGAKLLTVSNSGLQQNCYRPVQKLILLKLSRITRSTQMKTMMRGPATMKDQPEELQLKDSS